MPALRKPVQDATTPTSIVATISTLETTMPIASLAEQIRNRAYQLWEQRGREDGHDVEDWTQAEAEILAQHTNIAA